MGYFNGEQKASSEKSYQELTFLDSNLTGTCLVDTGNLIGSAMDYNLAMELKIQIIPHQSKGHAAQGEPLDVIGITTPLTFQFRGADKVNFTEQFLVIRNLTHKLNLGAKFLKQHQAIHHHHSGHLILHEQEEGKAVTIQLHGVQDNNANTSPQEGPFYVYSKIRTRIPAGTAKYIPVAVPALKGDMEVFIEPFHGTKNSALLAKSVGKLSNHKTQVAVFNPLNRDMFLEKWCRIGEATPVGTEAEGAGAVLGDLSSYDPSPGPSEDTEERRAWINKEFRLADSPFLAKDPEAHHRLENLLLEYWDTISKSKTDYGKTSLMELNIDLIPGAKPFKGHNRVMNPNQEEDLQKQMEAWYREDVIEDSNSPWGAPLIPAMKKDGRIRWCVDFRKLNQSTVKDSYPLPLIQGNLQKLGRSQIFSTLDGTGAYHNISINERDRPLTAFLTPWGQYHFKRMPFGLCNAPQAYSRLVEMVLRGLDPRQVLAYLDDIIIHSRNMEDHLVMMHQVLQAHRRAGLKIAPAKSFLFREEVDYLGHRVSRKGIRMIDDYVNLLVDWPKPNTPRELATFLGKAGYYRQFIHSYGQIAACLEAEKKKPQLTWTSKMEESFNKLKQAFQQKPILAFPNFESKQPFIFDTDWSKEGMAQTISQEQEGADGTRERLIGCGGRKCTEAESNYSSNKGETAAFVDGLERFEHLLRFAPFKARVDNRCLSYIKNLKKPTGIWNRWLEFINSFQFEINHRAGTKHGNVDALSRANHLPPPNSQQIQASQEFLCSMVEELNGLTLGAIQEEAEKEQILPISNKQLRRAQREDEALRKIIDYVQEGRKPSKEERKLESKQFQSLCQDFELLYLHKGILYRKILLHEPRLGPNDRLCIPEQLQDKALYWAHAHDSVGHLGIGATQKRIRARFFFPGMYNKVENYVLGCHKCLQKRGAPGRLNLPPRHTQRGFPGARWSLDLVGPMARIPAGNAYIMTAEDVFTRWPVAVPIPDKSAEGIAAAFEKYIVAEHGVCQELLTDNARELTGFVINDVARILGITKVETVPYNPNGNPIERFHRSLGQMLRSTVSNQQTDWEDKLPASLLAYRTAVHTTTKMTPFFLTHGREARLPIDIIFPRPPQQVELRTTYSVKLRENLDDAFRFVRDNQNKVIKREAALYSGTMDGDKLKEGDLVWYYSPRQNPGQVKKLHQGWCGPFKITKVISEVTYLITPDGDWTPNRPTIPSVIHRLKRYNPDTALAMNVQEEVTDEELINHLVDVVDENLESTGEVEIPTNWTEQQSYIKVSIGKEEEEMVDLGPINWGGGRDKDKEKEDIENQEVGKLQVIEECRPMEKTNGSMQVKDITEPKPAITEEAYKTNEEPADDTAQNTQQQDTMKERQTKRPRDEDTEQGPRTRRQARLEAEQRDIDRKVQVGLEPERSRSTNELTKDRPVTRGSTKSLDQLADIPLYMAAGAAAGALSRSAKRLREDVDTQEANKHVKTDQGLFSMTETFATMHLHSKKEEEEDKPTYQGRLNNTIVELPFHRIQIHPGGAMPVRGSIQAAGYDCMAREDVIIKKGTTGVIPLGFSIAPSFGTYSRLAETSTWAITKPEFILRAGVVDPDYRGEVVCFMTYLGPDETGVVKRGDRCAQWVSECFRSDPFHCTNNLPRSGRGTSAGFQDHTSGYPCNHCTRPTFSIRATLRNRGAARPEEGNNLLTSDDELEDALHQQD